MNLCNMKSIKLLHFREGVKVKKEMPRKMFHLGEGAGGLVLTKVVPNDARNIKRLVVHFSTTFLTLSLNDCCI